MPRSRTSICAAWWTPYGEGGRRTAAQRRLRWASGRPCTRRSSGSPRPSTRQGRERRRSGVVCVRRSVCSSPPVVRRRRGAANPRSTPRQPRSRSGHVRAPRGPDAAVLGIGEGARGNDVVDPGPVVLVGHSYGGAVITEAGMHDKVAALVYIAAFAPDKGESGNTLIADPPPGAPVPPILAPVDGYLFLDRDKFAHSFAADVPPELVRFIAAAQVPWGLDAVILSGAVAELVPRRLRRPHDPTSSPTRDGRTARAPGSPRPAGSHAVYVSQPAAVADVIEQAVRQLAAASRAKSSRTGCSRTFHAIAVETTRAAVAASAALITTPFGAEAAAAPGTTRQAGVEHQAHDRPLSSTARPPLVGQRWSPPHRPRPEGHHFPRHLNGNASGPRTPGGAEKTRDCYDAINRLGHPRQARRPGVHNASGRSLHGRLPVLT